MKMLKCIMYIGLDFHEVVMVWQYILILMDRIMGFDDGAISFDLATYRV